jgi:Zn-dependent protease with chaperone function
MKQACGFKKPLRLLIIEEDAVNAYSIGLRTIVISKSMTNLFLPEEIRGMIVHEMGHLAGQDRLIGMAYNTAVDFSQSIHRFLRRFSFLFILAGAVIFLLGYIQTGEYHFGALFFLPVYLLLYPGVHRAALFCWRVINRHRKYEHDEFACSIGYGHDLLNFLYRISMCAEMPVNPFDTIMRGNNPIIYNRIRRIEQLLGLRDQDVNSKKSMASGIN